MRHFLLESLAQMLLNFRPWILDIAIASVPSPAKSLPSVIMFLCWTMTVGLKQATLSLHTKASTETMNIHGHCAISISEARTLSVAANNTDSCSVYLTNGWFDGIQNT